MAEEVYEVDGFLNEVEENVELHNYGGVKESLPIIDMSKKYNVSKGGKVYPEFQGSIQYLPVIDKSLKKPMVFLNDVFIIQAYSSGKGYNLPRYLLDPKYYTQRVARMIKDEQGNEVEKVFNEPVSEDTLNRLEALYSTCKSLFEVKDNRPPWQVMSKKNIAVTKGFVISHKNCKNTTVVSELMEKGKKVSHENIPALIVLPSVEVSAKISEDLKMKNNPAAFSSAAYTYAPLAKREGWVTISFKSKPADGIGYNVSVLHDVLNKAIQSSVLADDAVIDPAVERQLVDSDLLSEFLQFQLGKNTYCNLDVLGEMERAVYRYVNGGGSDDDDDDEDYDEENETQGQPQNNNSTKDVFGDIQEEPAPVGETTESEPTADNTVSSSSETTDEPGDDLPF